MADREAIAAALQPAVAALDLQLYDVEITGTGRSRVLRVLIDRDGGIDLDAIPPRPRPSCRSSTAARSTTPSPARTPSR